MEMPSVVGRHLARPPGGVVWDGGAEAGRDQGWSPEGQAGQPAQGVVPVLRIRPRQGQRFGAGPEGAVLWGSRRCPEAMLDAAEDWADHYSQLAIYLRLNGFLPPTAKKKE